jgi:hypothetical protein
MREKFTLNEVVHIAVNIINSTQITAHKVKIFFDSQQIEFYILTGMPVRDNTYKIQDLYHLDSARTIAFNLVVLTDEPGIPERKRYLFVGYGTILGDLFSIESIDVSEADIYPENTEENIIDGNLNQSALDLIQEIKNRIKILLDLIVTIKNKLSNDDIDC